MLLNLLLLTLMCILIGNVSSEDTVKCAVNPCLNGGKCSERNDRYHCECTAGYAGNDCAIAEEKLKSDDRESRLNAISFLNEPRLLGLIPQVGIVRGLTVLGSELFVVRARSNQVNVYDTKNLNLIRNITIPGSSGLDAIVVSLRYNSLYISDEALKVVYRYNLSNNVVSIWSVGDVSIGLSLTSTHNVLVTMFYTKKIKEYTPYGSLVREISLDSSLVHPQHSIQLSSGQFVIDHGWRELIDRVCIVDTNGRIIQCYGGSKGSGVGQLNIPSNLAVDRHGNVLVADQDNDRVVLLSPSLTHLGYIKLPGLPLRRPFALHLDLLTRRLYIGEFDPTGRVLVLTV